MEASDTSGRVLAGGNEEGDRFDNLDRPSAVIVDQETDSLIIYECGNGRVTRWSRRSGTRSEETIIDNIVCHGLAMDDERSLYVTDLKEHAVRCYRRGETTGTLVAGGNGKGADLHQLNDPRYVFVDQEHAVYVSDRKNHRVMKWMKGAKEGIVVAGGRGDGKDLMQLSHPSGVLVDTEGAVYVADCDDHRVVRWCREARQGTVVVSANWRAQRANQLHRPSGLSFDRQGNLYVADESNHQVQRFLIEKD